MKHVLLTLFLLLVGYFGWYYADKAVKQLTRKLATRHVFAVVVIVFAVFAALIAAFYNRAISLL